MKLQWGKQCWSGSKQSVNNNKKNQWVPHILVFSIFMSLDKVGASFQIYNFLTVEPFFQFPQFLFFQFPHNWTIRLKMITWCWFRRHWYSGSTPNAASDTLCSKNYDHDRSRSILQFRKPRQKICSCHILKYENEEVKKLLETWKTTGNVVLIMKHNNFNHISSKTSISCLQS